MASIRTLTWPPLTVSSTNPANGSPNAPVPSVATLIAGEDGSGNLQNVAVDTDGQLQVDVVSSALPTGAATSAKQDDQTSALSALNARLGGSLTPINHDEISIVYVASGNGAGEIESVTYKLGGVTQGLLTLSYDAQNRLTGAVRS